jgi:transcription antitermination factor NusG
MCATSELLPTHSELPLNQLSWFAVQTRPRFEKKVTAELQEKGIQTFLPLNSAVHHWSDRRRLIHLPLFPGYIFVRTSHTPVARVSVLRTSGVTSFVGVKGMGIPIPDCEIEAVQAILQERVSFESVPYLKIGQRVRVRGGCLDGLTGTLVSVNGDQSLIVSVNLIQRSLGMRIEGYRVEAI